MITEYGGFTTAEPVALRQMALLSLAADAQVDTAECPVCLGQHDHDIHAATVSVRRWFREQVTLGLHEPW